MTQTWFERVGSAIPRGFSRYFILDLLQDRPCTGKEIIDHAVQQSNGIWKPSPGLVYPLLGRLLDEEMVKEDENSRYHLTKKGESIIQDVAQFHETVKKQIDVLFRMGNLGRFVAMDLLEKIITIGSMLGSNMANMTQEETAKYKQFLQTELDKINQGPTDREIKID